MAILHGKFGGMLEVVSIAYSPECPKGGYRITLHQDGELAYDQVHAVGAWIGGHGYLYDVAFGFLSSPRLIDEDVGFNLNEVAYDPVPKWVKWPREPACIQFGPLWMAFVVYGETSRYQGRLIVPTVLLELPEVCVAGTMRCLATTLSCPPEEAEQFGKTLWSELAQADRAREAAGLQDAEDRPHFAQGMASE
jgi:hypothetical protein